MKCQHCGADLARDHVRLFFGYEDDPELAVAVFNKSVLCDDCLERAHGEIKQEMETWEEVNDIKDHER